MKLISQLTIILFLYAVGEFIVHVTGLKFPGSIIGMILMIAALESKILKVESVKDVADFFLNNMMIFFIPLGVGLMDQWGLISKEWMPILIGTFVSTFVVIAIVSLIIQKRK